MAEKGSGRKVICQNKRARFDYEIGDLYEAGASPLSARRVRAQADRIDPPPRERKMRPLKRRAPRAKK